MIPAQDVEHRPIRVLCDYFERALEDLGLKVWLGLLMPGNEEYFRKRVEILVHAYPDQISQIRTLENGQAIESREEIFGQPDARFRWEPWEDPEEEISAHYHLQAAIVLALMGEQSGLRTMVAQMITEPMNRKLAISYFLGNLTEGRIGLTYKDFPKKAQILQWVHDMDSIQLSDRIHEIAKLRYQFS